MTNEEANLKFRQYRESGDIAIRNELVENYMYVAKIIVKKFTGRGVDYDDLLQVAYEALISGVEKFDPDMGNAFSTYITPTITGIIRNYFRDYSRVVRIPRKLYALSAKVKAAINEYYTVNGVKPTVKQLAATLGISEEEVIEAMEYKPAVSLDTTVKGEDSDVPLYEVITDDKNPFESVEDNEALKEEIAKLSPTEQTVIDLRFFKGKSQAEVGRILGVSQMFISRAEDRIIKNLRAALCNGRMQNSRRPHGRKNK